MGSSSRYLSRDGLPAMTERKIYLLQCPESQSSCDAVTSLLHARDISFAVLDEFLWWQTNQRLPACPADFINVTVSQVRYQGGKSQIDVPRLENRGQCLLHAFAGVFTVPTRFRALLASGESICILVTKADPKSKWHVSTFGIVICGHPRVVRKFQFRASESFYERLNVSWAGKIQEVASSTLWSTIDPWDALPTAVDFFRSKGSPSTTRIGGKRQKQSDVWTTEITVQQRWWLPNDVIRNDSFNELPPFPIAYYEIGRWYFEDWSARVLDPRTGKRVLLSKVHGPEYMSGSLHWQHIKDRKSYVHAERMWVGNKIVESVRAFADVVFHSIESGNTKVP